MSYTAVRRIQFCAGHRVFEHGSKCRHMHGHNYVAFIYATASLNNLGMVIDFSVLKEKVGGWIDAHWDHGFVFYEHDGPVKKALELFEGLESFSDKPFFQKVFPLPYNPTAENMAHFLLRISNELLLGDGVRVTKVELWETENCFASSESGEFVPGVSPPRELVIDPRKLSPLL